MADQDNLELTKEVIWNRRYKAWRLWFFALILVTLTCVFKDKLEFFKEYALWGTIGLVALIGGLSATDFIKLRNGGGK